MKAHIFNTVKAADIKEISITGKRWFQRSYGNTYHSVSVAAVVSKEVAEKCVGLPHYPAGNGDVWVDLAYVSDVYGYERHFEHTALQCLKQATEDAPKAWDDLHYICQAALALGVEYSENVYDVSRKKDL